MIVYTVTTEIRGAIVAALAAHGADPRMSGALGRVLRDESPVALAGIIAAWPAEDDGSYRIALSDVAGTLVWRAYMIAEIVAGRGLRRNRAAYREALGVTIEPAYEYVCTQAKGRGIRPCTDADHDSWTDATEWVLADGGTSDPRKRWARSAWKGRAAAHEAFAGAGLAIPERGTWKPIATLLFSTPRPVLPAPTLSIADDAALLQIAA